jgi:hypothetical protein
MHVDVYVRENFSFETLIEEVIRFIRKGSRAEDEGINACP